MKTARKSKTEQTTTPGAVQTATAKTTKTGKNTHLRLVGGTDFHKQFIELELDKIEPGDNWRKSFLAEDLEELTKSVSENGVLEPVLVRVADARGIHKLIAGERRWRASQLAGVQKIPARILDLPEDKIMDAHIQENLNRKDLTALEYAEGYQATLKDAEKRKVSLTVGELALRLCKPLKEVSKVLQLNKLIAAAKKDLANGIFPYELAYELAQYEPDNQKVIYAEYCYETVWNGDKHVPDKTRPVQLRQLKAKIAHNIMLDLKKAPFPIESKELRDDKLACPDCRNRTGAEATLFDDFKEKKEDYCLDKKCFTGKAEKHIQLVQITVARENVQSRQPKPKRGEQPVEITEAQITTEFSNVPHLSTYYYEQGGSVVGRDSYTEITNPKKACASAVRGVFVKGDRLAQTALVCLKSSKCPTHYPMQATSNVKSGDAFQKNRQELFNIRLDQFARPKVFAKGVEAFDENNTIWTDDVLRRLMLANLVEAVLGDYRSGQRRKLIAELLGIEETILSSNQQSTKDTEIFALYEKISGLSDAAQSKLFFLLTVVRFGENQHEGRHIKQDKVEFVASHLGINYNLLAAEAGVELCAARYKKQKPLADAHLQAAQISDAPIPFPQFFYAGEAQAETAALADSDGDGKGIAADEAETVE